MARKDKQIQKITRVPERFDTLFAEIRGLILSARNTVARGINLVQVHTNFEIGRHIIEHEQQGKGRAAYGQEVIGQLGERLTEEFGRGYSKRNLELMRQFFVVYSGRRRHIAQSLTAQLPSTRKTQSLIAQLQPDKSAQVSPFILSWTHYVFLLGITDPDERRFYEIEAAGQNWSLRELKRQFNTSLYERLALSRDERPTVGIILCKKKTDALVEITLPKDANIHARQYQLYLPSKNQLKQKLMEWIAETKTKIKAELSERKKNRV